MKNRIVIVTLEIETPMTVRELTSGLGSTNAGMPRHLARIEQIQTNVVRVPKVKAK